MPIGQSAQGKPARRARPFSETVAPISARLPSKHRTELGIIATSAQPAQATHAEPARPRSVPEGTMLGLSAPKAPTPVAEPRTEPAPPAHEVTTSVPPASGTTPVGPYAPVRPPRRTMCGLNAPEALEPAPTPKPAGNDGRHTVVVRPPPPSARMSPETTTPETPTRKGPPPPPSRQKSPAAASIAPPSSSDETDRPSSSGDRHSPIIKNSTRVVTKVVDGVTLYMCAATTGVQVWLRKEETTIDPATGVYIAKPPTDECVVLRDSELIDLTPQTEVPMTFRECSTDGLPPRPADMASPATREAEQALQRAARASSAAPAAGDVTPPPGRSSHPVADDPDEDQADVVTKIKIVAPPGAPGLSFSTEIQLEHAMLALEQAKNGPTGEVSGLMANAQRKLNDPETVDSKVRETYEQVIMICEARLPNTARSASAPKPASPSPRPSPSPVLPPKPSGPPQAARRPASGTSLKAVGVDKLPDPSERLPRFTGLDLGSPAAEPAKLPAPPKVPSLAPASPIPAHASPPRPAQRRASPPPLPSPPVSARASTPPSARLPLPPPVSARPSADRIPGHVKLNGLTQEFDDATSFATAEMLIEVASDPDVTVKRLWEILRKANMEQTAAIKLGKPAALIAAYNRAIAMATARLEGKPADPSLPATEPMPEVPDMRPATPSVAPAPQAPTGAARVTRTSSSGTSWGPILALAFAGIVALALIVFAFIAPAPEHPSTRSLDASGNVENTTSR